MAVRTLQEFIEAICPSACTEINLIEIGRKFAKSSNDAQLQYNYRHYHCNTFSLVIDAESCLDRLYGGFFIDWVCGGQWNNMVDFLTTFFRTIVYNNIEVTVFLDGSNEPNRFHSWIAKQKEDKDNIKRVLRHVAVKGTPPPKLWWIPPVCLRSCLRMILRHLKVNLAMSFSDHHQDVMTYCRRYKCHGLLAEDFEYLGFNPPRFFSSEGLRLTFKGCLETKEYVLNCLTKLLNLDPDCICILVALLGNHILTEQDLAPFHKKLCPHVKGKIPTNTLIAAAVDFVRKLSCVDLNVVGELVFGSTAYKKVTKLKKCVQYYMNENTIPPFKNEQIVNTNRGIQPVEKELSTVPYMISSDSSNRYDQLKVLEETQSKSGTAANESRESKQIIKQNKTFSTEKSQKKYKEENSLLSISTELLETVRERHQRGLISPWIYQVLSQREFKVPATFEDDTTREFPLMFLLYRPLRQMVYGILFDINYQRKDNKEKIPAIIIKEWVCTKSNAYSRPEFVSPTRLGWNLPSITRLWFDSDPCCSKQRLQAFLTCLRSNSPLMMNTSYVPPHLLILCCVLRYIVSNPDITIFQKHELDAFLVQAVDPQLSDPQQLQKMELPLVTARGVLLASTFMLGVEFALFANDVCGAAVSWLMCCPWLFFDGKLFHRKLLKASGAKNLIDLCENQIDLVAKVERMRTAILEGLQVQFAHPSVTHSEQSPFSTSSLTPPSSFSASRLISSSRGRGQRVLSQGGQLEVAGVVVGCWGHNYGQKLQPCSRGIPPLRAASNINRPSRFPTVWGRGSNINNKNCSAGNFRISLASLEKNKQKKNKKKREVEKPQDSTALSYVRSMGRGCTVETDSQIIEVCKLMPFGDTSDVIQSDLPNKSADINPHFVDDEADVERNDDKIKTDPA